MTSDTAWRVTDSSIPIIRNKQIVTVALEPTTVRLRTEDGAEEQWAISGVTFERYGRSFGELKSSSGAIQIELIDHGDAGVFQGELYDLKREASLGASPVAVALPAGPQENPTRLAEARFCSSCGTPRQAGALFCGACGRRFADASQEVASEAARAGAGGFVAAVQTASAPAGVTGSGALIGSQPPSATRPAGTASPAARSNNRAGLISVGLISVGLIALVLGGIVVANLALTNHDVTWSGPGKDLKEYSPDVQMTAGSYTITLTVSGPCYEAALWYSQGSLISLEGVEVQGPGTGQFTGHVYRDGPYHIEITDVNAANGPGQGCAWTVTVHKQ